MKITAYKVSEIGGRKANEDYVLSSQNDDYGYVFALADGLGGHGSGDAASQEACETAIDYFYRHPLFHQGMFNEVYPLCQEHLYARQKRENAEGKMRTTLNLVCIDDEAIYWSHVGDSRTYYFKDNQLIKRTNDHSVPQMLANIGEIKESEIRYHEDRNRVLKVLGVADQTPAFDAEEPVAISDNQQFLLCSDGFWEMITEEQMLECLAKSDCPRDWIESMLEIVHENAPANADNTSAIAIWIKGE